jgi:UrcA family protein
MKTSLLASGLGLLAVVAAGPAAAKTTPSLIINHAQVQHGDLDLATEAGAEEMLTRLNRAANNACGGRPSPAINDPVGSSKQHAYRLCKVAAIDAATLALDVPLLRTAWLESGDAIRFGDEARRTTAGLLARAGIDGPVDHVAATDRLDSAEGRRQALVRSGKVGGRRALQ